MDPITTNLWKEYDGKGFAAEYADYAKRATKDEEGNDIVQTYATKSELPDITIDTESDTVTHIGGKKISAKNAETDINGNSLELTISGDTVTAIGGKTVGSGSEQVQADWNQTDDSKPDYIKNIPDNLVKDSSYVHTDNNFTDEDKYNIPQRLGTIIASHILTQSDISTGYFYISAVLPRSNKGRYVMLVGDIHGFRYVRASSGHSITSAEVSSIEVMLGNNAGSPLHNGTSAIRKIDASEFIPSDNNASSTSSLSRFHFSHIGTVGTNMQDFNEEATHLLFKINLATMSENDNFQMSYAFVQLY